jgi:transposase
MLSSRRPDHKGSFRDLPGAKLLAPSLKPEQVVVMDNLSSHKGGRVRELIAGKGCQLLYLPPYSPDLNPIEEAFAPSPR